MADDVEALLQLHLVLSAGVDESAATHGPSPPYTLLGQPVTPPLQPGIYIVDGKKVKY